VRPGPGPSRVQKSGPGWLGPRGTWGSCWSVEEPAGVRPRRSVEHRSTEWIRGSAWDHDLEVLASWQPRIESGIPGLVEWKFDSPYLVVAVAVVAVVAAVAAAARSGFVAKSSWRRVGVPRRNGDFG